MKHTILKGFVCKESGIYFAPGSFYMSDDFNRVKELEKLGFVKANEGLKKPTRKKASDPGVRKGKKSAENNA